MRAGHDPISLSLEQRLREVAAVLARGLRRLRDGRDASPVGDSTSAEILSSDSSANCLEVPPNLRLSVHSG
jgi:hypothetical protein